MTRRLRAEVRFAVGWRTEDPTLADVQAWLREHPATYAQLLEGAQVASDWLEHDRGNGDSYWTRMNLRTEANAGRVYLCDGLWVADLFGGEEQLPGTWLSPREAQGAVDAALAELGWTLIGSVLR